MLANVCGLVHSKIMSGKMVWFSVYCSKHSQLYSGSALHMILECVPVCTSLVKKTFGGQSDDGLQGLISILIYPRVISFLFMAYCRPIKFLFQTCLILF